MKSRKTYEDKLLAKVLRRFMDEDHRSNWGNYIDVSLREVMLDGSIEITKEEAEVLERVWKQGQG